jgi:hypothetical protein
MGSAKLWFLLSPLFWFRNFNSLGLLRHLSRAGADQMQDLRQEPREAHANSKVMPVAN